ncbi:MAG: transglutaminase domain-containing protein [Candidatus Gracilibacteria bacterium]|nr:transglutaminase domain-containing protein [Candidatus Gracilibacteria bacterium]
MLKLKTKIKYNMKLGLNYLNYLKNKSLIIISHKLNKAHNTHVDNMIGYLSIAFVATIVILFNMNEYMKYIDLKYSFGVSIDSSYSYEQTDNISLNSALEISDIKIIYDTSNTVSGTNDTAEIKIDETNNGKMTTWGGKVDHKNKIEEKIRMIFNILPEINTEKQIIKQNIEPDKIQTNIQKIKGITISNEVDNIKANNTIKDNIVISNDTIKDNIVISNDINREKIKAEHIIVNEKSENIDYKKEIIIKQQDEIAKSSNLINNNKIHETNQDPVTIKNSTNDILAKKINSDIEYELSKLNGGIFNGFKIKILKNNNLVLENGVWYSYSYSKYHGFGKGIIPSEADLSDGGLNKNTHILLLGDNNGAMFITDYKKVKLVSDYIISDISNKQAFLNELADEKKYLTEDTDSILIKLKNDTINLTSSVNNSQKIQKIYDYILKNVSYSKVFNVNNRYIFSGVHTYNNNDGICTGYARLYLYMLSFAGIENVKVIKGNVVDGLDFPNIGHAWVQIGNNYYDPTFDDPIGNTNTKSYNEYKYFGLPRDLFYTNRFNYGDLPNNLKNADLETRKNYVITELTKLQSKYSDYNLIKSITN